MGFPKGKRIEDPKLIEHVKRLSCTACRKEGPSDAHHVTSRGAGGPDTRENVMPLCRLCHTRWHSLGPGYMVRNFTGVKRWLKKMERDDVLSRVERAETWIGTLSLVR